MDAIIIVFVGIINTVQRNWLTRKDYSARKWCVELYTYSRKFVIIRIRRVKTARHEDDLKRCEIHLHQRKWMTLVLIFAVYVGENERKKNTKKKIMDRFRKQNPHIPQHDRCESEMRRLLYFFPILFALCELFSYSVISGDTNKMMLSPQKCYLL